MRNIRVEPARLIDTANKVEEASQDYERIYKSLYSEVDKLSSSWTGKENTSFTNQIKTYEEDFRQIAAILKQYVEFLRNSARAYMETQDELDLQAKSL